MENIAVHHLHMTERIGEKRRSLRRTFLREWREAKDLPLERAAPEFGITHGQLSKIERGLSPYNQRLLEKAAELYGCSVVDLLTRRPGEAEDLLEMYSRLTPSGKRRAARMFGVIDDE